MAYQRWAGDFRKCVFFLLLDLFNSSNLAQTLNRSSNSISDVLRWAAAALFDAAVAFVNFFK